MLTTMMMGADLLMGIAEIEEGGVGGREWVTGESELSSFGPEFTFAYAD